MALAFLQIVFTIGAGFGLWHLWRQTASADPRVTAIVGAGFVFRAVLAQALFWVSWLELPIGRSLQAGNGFWFFALDGTEYLANADRALANGPLAVFLMTSVTPSHTFVQVVALLVAIFGGVASVAILLNCAAYLGTCAIVVRLAGGQRHASGACLFALSALAFGPAAMLWSLQLLKDTIVAFLAVAILGGYAAWQDFWQEKGRATTHSRRRMLAVLAGMAVCYFALTGMRWYFALIVLTASVPFMGMVAWTNRRRRRLLALSAATIVLFSQAARLGGDADVPPPIRQVLAPGPSMLMESQASGVKNYLVRARHGFQNAPAATTIVAGPILGQPAPPATADGPVPAVTAGKSISEKIVDEPNATDLNPSTVQANREGEGRERRRYRGDLPPAWPPGIVADLSARLALVILPRGMAEAAGLARVGGGRGLWLFADIDTIAFDIVLLVSVILSARSLASSRGVLTPLFVLLVLAFVLLLPPMIYTVSNFGTLFRLRQMLYLLAALAPLTLAVRPRPLTNADLG